MSQRIEVNTNILTWAINRAGYEMHDFLLKFPKTQDWIDNKKKPTIKQLESFSKKVYVPFGYLLLKEPPKEELPIPYFRTGKGALNEINLNVYDTILMLQSRQEWLVDYLKDNEFEALQFVGKYNDQTNYLKIVRDIRQTLQLELDWARNFSTWEKALEHLTQRIEDIGIITTFNGIVGNNTRRKIKVEDCRGFVLVDEFAPFMFINNSDAKAAQMFTIIHELAHIWLGKSAGFDFKQMLPADDPIEKLCDLVAAEFLVPENLLLDLWKKDQKIKSLARKFKVSPIVIGRRALDLKLISRKYFFNFYKEYIEGLKNRKAKQGPGGNFYATAKKRISLTFAAHVNTAAKQNQILYKDAYKLTNLKGNTYQQFMIEYSL